MLVAKLLVNLNVFADVSLRITDGEFSWLPDTNVILRDIKMEVATGSLTAVVGQVGSGKSTLLSACVGDVYKHKGTVTTKVGFQTCHTGRTAIE